LAFLPFVVRGGINDLNGIGWGRGILLAVLGGPCFAIISRQHKVHCGSIVRNLRHLERKREERPPVK
jgi:hypothetical protein